MSKTKKPEMSEKPNMPSDFYPRLLYNSHTNKLSWLVWPLVNEVLEGFLERVDKLLVAMEALVHHLIHLVFKV